MFSQMVSPYGSHDRPRRERLHDHSSWVARWADACDPLYRNTLRVIGWSVEIDSHEMRVRRSWDGRANRYSGKRRLGKFSSRTLQRHVLERLEPAGLVVVERGLPGVRITRAGGALRHRRLHVGLVLAAAR